MREFEKSQVIIIGGGPSGLLLSQLLSTRGIDSVILERRARAHVLSRIRAGVLEQGFVRLMEEAGCAERVHAEGIVHEGTQIAHPGGAIRIDFQRLAGMPVVIYGQTEVTRDLYAARDKAAGRMLFEVGDVAINDAATDAPYVTFRHAGRDCRIRGDFVAGCDGFHGVSRGAIPAALRREYEKVYPFGWLGVLSETPPVDDELLYANSDRGFALCSMRNRNLSRYYIQCSADDRPEDWPDARFWEELCRRIPADAAARLVTGPSIEKSIAPLRSFVGEPMRWGRLFLCGDAAHIVPPTGAKGLNTAGADVHYLFAALSDHYERGDDAGIEGYSARALSRVWKSMRFSWWMTGLLHRFPETDAFDLRLQAAELDLLASNTAAQKTLAQNYVGLPY